MWNSIEQLSYSLEPRVIRIKRFIEILNKVLKEAINKLLVGINTNISLSVMLSNTPQKFDFKSWIRGSFFKITCFAITKLSIVKRRAFVTKIFFSCFLTLFFFCVKGKRQKSNKFLRWFHSKIKFHITKPTFQIVFTASMAIFPLLFSRRVISRHSSVGYLFPLFLRWNVKTKTKKKRWNLGKKWFRWNIHGIVFALAFLSVIEFHRNENKELN